MANPPGWNPKAPVKVPRSSTPDRARVALRVEEYDTLIKQQGVRVKVYRTMLCPNVKSIDGSEHEIDCKVCRGSGFVDLRPIDTWAFIQSQELEKLVNPEGLVDGNSVAATFLRDIELQYFTLVEICDHTDVFFERIKRQAGDVDVLKYQAKCVNAVVDQDGKEYFPQIDFTLDPNGSIRWKEDRAPGAGTIYSVHYEMTLKFRAVRALHVNRFGQKIESQNIEMVKMPEQWMLQKVFFVDRTDRNGNALAPNLIRDPDEDPAG